jgi:peptide/nickel transport system permease protein
MPDVSPSVTADLPADQVRSGLFKVLKPIGLLRESPVGMVGTALVLFWVFVAVFAPVLAPFDPLATLDPLRCPSWWQHDYCPKAEVANTYLLGTDHLGRDMFSRLVWATRRVLIYAPLATGCAYAVGIMMGLAAGYYRGWVDNVLSRFADLILSFPVLVLYILIIAHFGASPFNIVIAIVFASGPGIMRIVRGLVLDLRTREYVAAAETRGEPSLWIMVLEILPNARGPLIVDACLRLGYVTIAIGVLGFLGLGLPPPDPDWGGMINEARGMAILFPHMTVFPCIAISSLILGFNLMADGLREISLRD